ERRPAPGGRQEKSNLLSPRFLVSRLSLNTDNRPLVVCQPSNFGWERLPPSRSTNRLGWSLALPNSAFTVVDNSRHLRAQIFARHDAIDEAVLEQEFAGLKTFRQLQPHRVPDGSFARKTDHRTRLGQRNVSLERKAGSNASHRGIGQNGDIETAGAVISSQCC